MERTGNAPPDDIPVALVTEGTHGPVIHDVNRAARLAGIAPGARVTDMRSLCPNLQIEYADIAGDRVTLQKLMLWARRWCPWTTTDGENGLVMDTTGSDHLWGGETEMLRDIEAKLALLGLDAQLALAHTWGAAWALARFGGVRQISRPETLGHDLASLPVESLRLNSETCLLLSRLGLKTVGALSAVPRTSLARRFARAKPDGNPLHRLDQINGHLPEPVSSPSDLPRFEVQANLPEPIQDPSPYLPDLCQAMCTRLADQGYGCRSLILTVFRTDGEISQLSVRTSTPNRDADHLQKLFGDRLERINPGFGFDLISLEAGDVTLIDTVQTTLDGTAEEALALPRLIDRLTARLGPRAVTRPQIFESHVPERAQGQLAALADIPPQSAKIRNTRPITLLPTPEEVKVLYAVPEGPPVQFTWRKQTLRITRYAGPERIAPEWWHDRPNARLRDYFRIEVQDGRRIWLYREGLHGDGRGGDPRWFIHGFFA